MQITERSSKPEIITAALELTDHQAGTIARLQQQQRILWAAVDRKSTRLNSSHRT